MKCSFLVYSQNIGNYWDYCKFTNKNVTNGSNRTITSVWLHNGKLVEEGFGYVVIPMGDKAADTIRFLYNSGSMIFSEEEYRKFPKSSDSTKTRQVKEWGENKVTLCMSCFFVGRSGEKMIKQYECNVPLEWIKSPVETDILHNPVFRITELYNGFFMMTVDTYGRYRTYKNHDKKNQKYLQRKILRKHKSYYGNK